MRATAVLFVTHEINPVLPYVDRVLYLVDGRFRIGTVDEVMTSENLSALCTGPSVDVVHVVTGHSTSSWEIGASAMSDSLNACCTTCSPSTSPRICLGRGFVQQA